MIELAAAFETHRDHLRRVAHRMLGSPAEADDAVQETWLRLARSEAAVVENLRGWLTTVTARICLDMLRARRSRGEETLAAAPEPAAAAPAPEELELADSVGIALLIVLDKLEPAERLAFVLHDLFAMPFDEIAAILGRSTAAARQLASRARRRVRGASPPEADLASQRRVVEAFLAALRGGDVAALLAVLDPQVVARVDGAPREIREASEWARGAVAFQRAAEHMRVVLVDGHVALAFAPGGRIARVLRFGFAGAKIRAVQVITEPAALAGLVVEALP